MEAAIGFPSGGGGSASARFPAWPGWLCVGIDPRLLISGGEILTGGGQPQVEQTRSPSGRRANTGAADSMRWQSDHGRYLGDLVWPLGMRNLPGQRSVLISAPARAVSVRDKWCRCGTAQSAMGPFYCLLEKHRSSSTLFFQQVEMMFAGCSGNVRRFTAAAIIAHEAGDHIQTVLGIFPKVTRLQQQAGSKAPANELQVKFN